MHNIPPELGLQTRSENILYWHQSQPVSSHCCGGCQESFIQTSIFLSPLIPLGSVFINYGSKMCLNPRKRFKREIHEVFLVAYLHLLPKRKVDSMTSNCRMGHSWAEVRELCRSLLVSIPSLNSSAAGSTRKLQMPPHFLAYKPRMPGEHVSPLSDSSDRRSCHVSIGLSTSVVGSVDFFSTEYG